MNSKPVVATLTSPLLLVFVACTRPGTEDLEKLIPCPRIGQVQACHSSEIPASPFGIQAGTLVESLVERAAEIGVKWTRLGISWPSVEKEKGVYLWEETDKAIEIAKKNGITPFVYIGPGNSLYAPSGTYEDLKLAAIYGSRPETPIKDPEAMKAFLKFVRAAIERYRDQIDNWEVWNEPNHRNYWGVRPDGKGYGRLLVQIASLNLKPVP